MQSAQLICGAEALSCDRGRCTEPIPFPFCISKSRVAYGRQEKNRGDCNRDKWLWKRRGWRLRSNEGVIIINVPNSWLEEVEVAGGGCCCC